MADRIAITAAYLREEAATPESNWSHSQAAPLVHHFTRSRSVRPDRQKTSNSFHLKHVKVSNLIKVITLTTLSVHEYHTKDVTFPKKEPWTLFFIRLICTLMLN